MSRSVSVSTPRSVLGLLDGVLERLPRHPARDVAEHLHEAPVGVPREAVVLGLLGEPLDRLVVEAEVEDRVEHARHRLAGARAHAHQQRVVVVAELLARLLLEPLERVGHLLGHALGLLLVGLHVGDAGLGGDREAGRDALGAQHPRHLRDVRALAAEQLAHVARALGEVVDPLLVRHGSGTLRHGPPPDVRVVLDRRVDRALGLGERARLGLAGCRRADGRWRRRGSRGRPGRARTRPPRRRCTRRRRRRRRSRRGARARRRRRRRRAAGAKPAASSSLRRKASALARPALRRVGVEQRELVGEQVVDALVGVAVVEQAADGVAGARGGVERRPVLAQPPVAGERLGAT